MSTRDVQTKVGTTWARLGAGEGRGLTRLAKMEREVRSVVGGAERGNRGDRTHTDMCCMYAHFEAGLRRGRAAAGSGEHGR
jgi:hypothetical protein